MTQFKVIVGLGNPGEQYALTRHNVGFMLIDYLALKSGARVKRRECTSLVGHAIIENLSVDLVKPQTFMNFSGEAVACILKKREEDTSSLIVITDDVALPFGTIRLRQRGSAGGHNGLKSIIAALRTEEFARLRIGVQPDHPVASTKEFVLDRFTSAESAALPNLVSRSAEALRMVLRDGFKKAMSLYNVKRAAEIEE